jgi:hypothetical protein
MCRVPQAELGRGDAEKTGTIMKRHAWLILLAAGVALPVSGKSLVIVEEGRPKARIVTGADATPTAKFAARELQRYVEKSTGAKLPITNQRSRDGMVDIVIGAGQIATQLGVTTTGLTRDAFRIKTVGNTIVIVGRDDPRQDPAKCMGKLSTWAMSFEHATVFGVYEFLERFLGVRWYTFLPIGEVVPKHRTIAIPPLDVLEIPKKLARHASTLKSLETVQEGKEAGYKLGYGTIDMKLKAGEDRVRRRNQFSLRARHNTVLVRIHTMHQIVSPRRYAEPHPEFFALTKGGKRLSQLKSGGGSKGAQHCFSQPQMADIIADEAIAFFRGETAKARGFRNWAYFAYNSPWGNAFHLLQSDGFRPCHCDACRKATNNAVDRIKDRGQLQLAYGRLIWNFWIRIAEKVKREAPEGTIIIYVYGPTKAFPEHIRKLPDNVAIELATAGPYRELGTPESAEAQLKDVEKWADLLSSRDRMRLHIYVTGVRWNDKPRKRAPRAFCGSIPRAMAAYCKRFRDVGIGSYMYEGAHSVAYEHLNDYVFYKFHWNPDLDIEAVLRDYYQKCYGPAAVPMGKFWDEIEAKFPTYRGRVVDTGMGPEKLPRTKESLWTDVYDAPTLARWTAYFSEAVRLASGSDDPMHLTRVQFMKENVLDFIVSERPEGM